MFMVEIILMPHELFFGNMIWLNFINYLNETFSYKMLFQKSFDHFIIAEAMLWCEMCLYEIGFQNLPEN